MADHAAAPELAHVSAELAQLQAMHTRQTEQFERNKQELANHEMSDRVSRAANADLQSSLAQRDELVAALRSNIAFYERLIGSKNQGKSLEVHSLEFQAEQANQWSYNLVLMQNLNRGAMTRGQLRFTIAGILDGQPQTLSWEELHGQQTEVDQTYSFRYFQQLSGNIFLPSGFKPERVNLSLSHEGRQVDQTLPWTVAGNGADDD